MIQRYASSEVTIIVQIETVPTTTSSDIKAQSDVTAELKASMAGTVSRLHVVGQTVINLNSEVSLVFSGHVFVPKVTFELPVNAELSLYGSGGISELDTLDSADGDMALRGVIQEICCLWKIPKYTSAPSFAIVRALNDVNAAMQIVWNNSAERNYWTRSVSAITFAMGVKSMDLDNTIQNVIGSCRLSTTNRPLAALGTLAEWEQFEDLYLDGNTSDEPLAYYIDRSRQAGSDSAKCSLKITPAPQAASTILNIDVVLEAPRYSVADINENTVIQIPHRYVETLLMPIALYRASSFAVFRVKPDIAEGLARNYKQALEALGLADPLPGKSGDNLERREERK